MFLLIQKTICYLTFLNVFPDQIIRLIPKLYESNAIVGLFLCIPKFQNPSGKTTRK